MQASAPPVCVSQTTRGRGGDAPVSLNIHLRLPIGRVIAGMAIVYTKGNETLKRLTIFGWAGLLLLALTSLVWAAQNDDLDFKLVNSTGVNIYSIYIAPHDSKDWGDDVMKQDILRDGESVDLQFHPKAKSSIWDLRIEDKDGNSVEWDSLNLSEIETLTIKLVKGKAVAEWK